MSDVHWFNVPVTLTVQVCVARSATDDLEEARRMAEQSANTLLHKRLMYCEWGVTGPHAEVIDGESGYPEHQQEEEES